MTALTPAQQDMQAWQAEAGRVPGNYRFVTGSAQSFLEGWNYRDRRDAEATTFHRGFMAGVAQERAKGAEALGAAETEADELFLAALVVLDMPRSKAARQALVDAISAVRDTSHD